MTFSEAIIVVKQYPEIAGVFNRFHAHVVECAKDGKHYAGSMQFSVDGECFYYAGESYLDERDGKHHTIFNGGKHTPWRSRQLLAEGKTWIVR